jgi:hypothetical protein
MQPVDRLYSYNTVGRCIRIEGTVPAPESIVTYPWRRCHSVRFFETTFIFARFDSTLLNHVKVARRHVAGVLSTFCGVKENQWCRTHKELHSLPDWRIVGIGT